MNYEYQFGDYMFRRILMSSLIAILLTVITALLAYMADAVGASTASNILLWPNSLLQTFVPLHNIGTSERPIYEGTPLNFIAFVASFPLAIFVYGCLVFFVLGYSTNRQRMRHT